MLADFLNLHLLTDKPVMLILLGKIKSSRLSATLFDFIVSQFAVKIKFRIIKNSSDLLLPRIFFLQHNM